MVQHREQAVPLPREDLELRVGDHLYPLLQEVDAGKRIAVAAHEKDGAADLLEVIGSQLLGESRPVQRIGKEDEAGEVRLDRSHACHAASVGLATTDYIATRLLDKDLDCALRVALRQVDGQCIEASMLETNDVRLHRCSGARGSVTENDFHVDSLVDKVDELSTATAQTCSSTVNKRGFHAMRAAIAACMLIDVMRRRDHVALVLFDCMSREKNSSYPLTNAMHTMYQDSLYGVSACGCHHRGNGPDASQRPISHIRCGTGHRSRLTKRS